MVQGRRVEIHHVGDDARGDAMPRGDLLGLDGVDDYVPDGWQVGGKGCCKIIVDAVDLEALTLPVEIVVVGDGRVARLGDELGQGQAERQVERNRHSVFNNQNLQV